MARKEVRQGLIWSTIDKVAAKGVNFMVGIVLARILAPEQFGIIVMPLVFLELAQCIADSGFGNALIRKKQLTDADLSTAFLFNIIVGIICYLLFFVCSPLIASFYSTSILEDLLKVSALGALFNSLCVLPRSVLSHRLDFRSQAIASLSASVISGAIGVVMAYSGFGVWALVAQQVSRTLLQALLLWVSCRWVPSMTWSKESFQYLWGFGSKLLATSLLDTLFNNLNSIIIGKVYSAAKLGNYSRASQLGRYPVTNASGVILNVAYPVLSKMQEDEESLAHGYRKMIKLSAFLIFPIMMAMSALSDPLILLLIGDHWAECIPLLSIMTPAFMLYPINAINLNLLQVKGRSDLFLRLGIITKVISVIALIITVPMGITEMVVGILVSSWISLIFNTYYSGKLIHIGLFSQLKDILPMLTASLVTAFITWKSLQAFSGNVIRLAAGIIIFTAVYGVIARIFMKEEIKESYNLIKSRS